MKSKISATVVLAALSWGPPARAHDKWGNGDAVPAWVKSWCCDKTDVHHIPDEAVHVEPDGYHIEGLKRVVPYDSAIPSPDGTYWGFWSPVGEPDPQIYCFFAPVKGS